jgi:hypothetical protein
MRPGAKIPKLSGFPLGTTTSHSPRRVDITGEKGALRRPHGGYITAGWWGPHVVTEELIEFRDAALCQTQARIVSRHSPRQKGSPLRQCPT